MVQFLLDRVRRRLCTALIAAGAALATVPIYAAHNSRQQAVTPVQWELALEGGRTLTWERNFSSEAEVKPNRGFWDKLVDAIAGAPEFHFMVRPYSIATDSHGRIIVTDPGAAGVHVFDFAQHKYKFIQRVGKRSNSMGTPQCVAVDAQDNIYVTDSDAGVIFVFEPSGKYLRSIGSLKGGEGYFKRPTGIAIDSAAQRIYVADTLRDAIFVLDMQGTIVQKIGETGDAPGQFNLPTELRLNGPNLVVMDAMNFRVQVFDRSGNFQYSIGKLGDGLGSMFRPKGMSFDSEGNLYVADAAMGTVQVFNQQGQLLYYFGTRGTRAGEFQLPAGMFIDHSDQVFVVDSFNRRVQVFQYVALKSPNRQGAQ